MAKKYCIFSLFCVFCIGFYSCDKVNITFTGNSTAGDPNVIYLDNNKVNISTMKLDSFSTAGGQVFMIGTHFDSSFGKISADSYSEVQIPASNTVKGLNVIFDSLQLVLMPNGNFAGDTNSVYKISVYRLDENINIPTINGSSTGLFFGRTGPSKIRLSGSRTLRKISRSARRSIAPTHRGSARPGDMCGSC